MPAKDAPASNHAAAQEVQASPAYSDIPMEIKAGQYGVALAVLLIFVIAVQRALKRRSGQHGDARQASTGKQRQ